MKRKDKEQKQIEALFEARKNNQNWLSGKELAEAVKKNFQENKEHYEAFLKEDETEKTRKNKDEQLTTDNDE